MRIPLLTPDQLAPHQKAVMEAKGEYVHIDGAMGTLKTTACILRLYAHMAANPRITVIVSAQTYKQLEIVFVEEWKNQIPQAHYTYNKTDQKIQMRGTGGKGKILLWYADDHGASEKFKGVNAGGFYVIQAETLKSKAFMEALDLRVRQPGVEFIRLIDSNPGSPMHWLYTGLIDHTHAGYWGGDVETDEIHDYYSVRKSSRATYINVKATVGYCAYTQEQLDLQKKKLAPADYERMIQGRWVASEGRVYDAVTWVDPPEPKDILEYWIGLDPGTSGGVENLAMVWIGRHVDGHYVVFHESLTHFKGMDAVLGIISAVNDRWDATRLRFIVKDWHGGSGSVFKTELEKAGYGVFLPAQDQGKWSPIGAGVAMLYQAFISEQVRISRACRLLERDIGSYVVDDTGQPDKKQFDSHLLDALRYGWLRIGRYV